MERVKSSLMNMMWDDQSRSSKYAVATVSAMPLAACLALTSAEGEGKSSSGDEAGRWCSQTHSWYLICPRSSLKPQFGVLRCNFRCMAFSELEVVVEEIHRGSDLILQEVLLGILFCALILALRWFRTKSFVSHCEQLVFSLLQWAFIKSSFMVKKLNWD